MVAAILRYRALDDIERLGDGPTVLIGRSLHVLVRDIGATHFEVGVHAPARQAHAHRSRCKFGAGCFGLHDVTEWWDRAYEQGSAPWDIGRPQPVWVRLTDDGEITAPVLDSGCGTGEHALFLAGRGMEVLGVDLSPVAIERARGKAEARGVAVEFVVGDVLELHRLGRQFATIIDSGVFHVFDDADRVTYVRSVASVLQPDGVLHLLCFSDQVPGSVGPRRVSQAELRDAFADGWSVERIESARFEVREDWELIAPHAWLARIVRQR